MTTTVTLIRHGESVANAGGATAEAEQIPLTSRGVRQAERIAARLGHEPDLIVMSAYRRALQTAEPTRRRFPDVPCEIWEIHEASYLNSLRGRVTTPGQRKPYVEAWWTRADPDYRDSGPGSESFRDMWARADAFLGRLAELDGQRVVAFGHGLFTRLVLWAIITGTTNPDADTMRTFWRFQNDFRVPNGSMITLRLDADHQPRVVADETVTADENP